MTRRLWPELLVLATAMLALLAACAGGETAPAATPQGGEPAQPAARAEAPSLPPNPLAGVAGIVDPTNHGWPRQVEVLNGLVTIPRKPERIVTVSLGHDEITLGLVPPERMVAVGRPTKDYSYSNVAALVQEKPTVSREPERVISFNPDIVVVSKFTKTELVEALERVGILVIQTGLQNDPAGRINDIRLLGYIYGEEERAEVVAREVEERLHRITSFAEPRRQADRTRVLSLTSYSDKIYTSGSSSTEGGIILAAGGRNAAAEAGLTRNPTISLEGIISMAPELIIIPQTKESAEPFIKRLLSDPALAEVPAIQNRRLFHVPSRYFTTLSFWNVRGVEELAKLLWPQEFGDVEFAPFAGGSVPPPTAVPGS